MEYEDYVPGGDDAEGYGQEGHGGGAYEKAIEINTRVRVRVFENVFAYRIFFLLLWHLFIFFFFFVILKLQDGFTLNSFFFCYMYIYLDLLKGKKSTKRIIFSFRSGCAHLGRVQGNSK